MLIFQSLSLANLIFPFTEQIEAFITVCEVLLSQNPGVLEVSINKKARDDRAIHIKDCDVDLISSPKHAEALQVIGSRYENNRFLRELIS